VAEVDGVRVYRGIYNGFALAMSGATEGLRFDELPSSDELADRAFRAAGTLIERDPRDSVPAAQQELTSLLVCLTLIERGGSAEDAGPDVLAPALDGLWKVLGERWTP
jgi:hypothetical protein